MDKIEGVPEGYRLKGFYRRGSLAVDTPYLGGTGEVWRIAPDDPFDDVVAVLIPEQPKQFEAVIVVPISAAGYMILEKAIEKGAWHKTMADSLAKNYPDRVTIREREKGKE